MKDLYIKDVNFFQVYVAYEFEDFDNFYKVNRYLFFKKKLYVPNCYMHELLVCEAHGDKLLRHFEVVKTLDVFHEHFY